MDGGPAQAAITCNGGPPEPCDVGGGQDQSPILCRHCIGSGPGPNVFDPLMHLIDWVEKDVEPKRIIANHFLGNDPSTGVVTRSMPLCSYPQIAHFNGGDVSRASNWSCQYAGK
jgi:hypothetical protein